MKQIKLLLETNKIKGKLDKAGHELNRVLVTNESGEIITSLEVTREEVEFLAGLERNAQEQLNEKADNFGYTASKIIISDEDGNISVSEISNEKLNFLKDINSDLKETLDSIQDSINTNTENIGKVSEKANSNEEAISDLTDIVNTNSRDIESLKLNADKIDLLEKFKKEAETKIKANEDNISTNADNINLNTDNIKKHEDEINILKELIGSGSDNGVDLSNLYTKQGGEIYGDVIVKKENPSFELDVNREEKSGVRWNATETEDNGLEIYVDGIVVGKFESNGSFSLLKEDRTGFFQVKETSEINLDSIYIVDNTKENAFTDIVIQEAINKARLAGGGVVFIPFGEYLLENEILLYSNIKIVGTKGTILKRRNSSMKVFMRAGLKETDGGYNGLVNFEIHNIMFDGEEKTEVTGMLCLGHGNRIRVKNCIFKNLLNNWHMIEINGCKDVVIEDNVFENYRGTESIQIDFMLNDEVYPFPCLKDETVCDGITIKNNIFKKISGTAVGHHSFKANVIPRNITIKNNHFEDVSEYCVHLSDIEKFVVKDNKIFNAQYGVVIDFYYTASKEILIADNYMDLQKRADSTGVQGRGITISPSAMDGIMDVVIRNNIVKNAVRYGIAVTASNLTIDGNTVQGCGLTGIWAHGGNCSTIINNFAKGNNTRGDSAHFDLALGGNSNAQHRYSNLNNNHAWTFGIKSNTFPVVIMQNNFMNVPTVASGINAPLAYYNFIAGTFKAEGLSK